MVNIILISVHIPTEGKTKEEKENFYNELVNVIDTISITRILVILGNLNEKIGKEILF